MMPSRYSRATWPMAGTRVSIQPRLELATRDIKGQCCHEDPGRRRPQYLFRAGVQCRTRRPHIIDEDESTSGRWRPSRVKTERAIYIYGSILPVEVNLRLSLPRPHQ